MGIVIPFEKFKLAQSSAGTQRLAAIVDDEQAITKAMHAASDQSVVLAAARPLLDRCRDRHGFVIMREGLPQVPTILGRAILELSRGLSMIDADMGAPRSYPTFGVYFGRRHLAWFEDGYSGTTALAVPDDTMAADLAAFVRPRVSTTKSRSKT